MGHGDGCADRVLLQASGGRDRNAAQQPSVLCRLTRQPAPTGGSALEAGPQLCPHRCPVAAAERGQRRQRSAGVAADPAADP